MVSLRGMAFVLGALGLVLFLAGILWALLTPPDAACNAVKACERGSYARLLTSVMWVVGAGLVVEAVAVVILLLNLSRRAPPKRAPPPPPPPPPSNPGAPRNRFLEPPVPGVRRPAPPPGRSR